MKFLVTYEGETDLSKISTNGCARTWLINRMLLSFHSRKTDLDGMMQAIRYIRDEVTDINKKYPYYQPAAINVRYIPGKLPMYEIRFIYIPRCGYLKFTRID